REKANPHIQNMSKPVLRAFGRLCLASRQPTLRAKLYFYRLTVVEVRANEFGSNIPLSPSGKAMLSSLCLTKLCCKRRVQAAIPFYKTLSRVRVSTSDSVGFDRETTVFTEGSSSRISRFKNESPSQRPAARRFAMRCFATLRDAARRITPPHGATQ